MTKVSVLGAGAWGTALAIISHSAGRKTTLWAKDSSLSQEIKKTQENKRYLAGIKIAPSIEVTSDLGRAAKADIILLAVPAQTIRFLAEQLKSLISSETYLVICAKGIEMKTGLLMNEVLREVFSKNSISVLSGPTFAKEVAQGLPTAATLANNEIASGRWLASSLSSHNFRLYPSEDITGVCISGALKNVIAIAAGIATAKNYGESARASLITRGLAEMTRLGKIKKARPETFLGLSGVGDLILSCTSTQSRNMSLGFLLGQKNISFQQLEKGFLTEGAFTVEAVAKLAKSLKIDMPISKAVYNIIHKNSPIDEEIKTLLSRPIKNENYL
jgi:glycerol-3-phosphate dehydrogenase (NAD(P)+)